MAAFHILSLVYDRNTGYPKKEQKLELVYLAT